MKQWYVVQVFTGFEDVVKVDLITKIKEESLQDYFGKIIIPRGKTTETSNGDEEKKKEKIFPGYLLVQMEMTGESFRAVTTISRVTRFLGGETPMPISEKEVDRIFSQMEGKLPVAVDKPGFVIGHEIQISSGPFSGFVGIIEKVDEEHEKLTVMVSIFGRLTPVELDFDQVKE